MKNSARSIEYYVTHTYILYALVEKCKSVFKNIQKIMNQSAVIKKSINKIARFFKIVYYNDSLIIEIIW